MFGKKDEEVEQRKKALYARTEEYKLSWDKGGIIQFKNERIAILKRAHGAQVEFIVAFDDLTKDGYRLCCVDEGRSVEVSGISGGTVSYYYFQRGL